MPVPIGCRATVRAAVTPADTSTALGSGDVAVLGTPRVVALLESATVAAVAPHLDPGRTTVGVRVDVEHVRASPVGAAVSAEAELTGVDGRLLVFAVRLIDGDDVAAHGQVVRAEVDRARFEGSVARRAGMVGG